MATKSKEGMWRVGPRTFNVACPVCGRMPLPINLQGGCERCKAVLVPLEALKHTIQGYSGGRKRISGLHEAVLKAATAAILQWGAAWYVTKPTLDGMEAWLEAQGPSQQWEPATAHEFETMWLKPVMEDARETARAHQEPAADPFSMAFKPPGWLAPEPPHYLPGQSPSELWFEYPTNKTPLTASMQALHRGRPQEKPAPATIQERLATAPRRARIELD